MENKSQNYWMMENEFSFLELRIIQSLIPLKSFAEIAEAIDKPLPMVSDYIINITKNKNRSSRQQQINAKNDLRNQKKEASLFKAKTRLPRKPNKDKIERERRQAERLTIRRQQVINEQNRKSRRQLPEFKTKEVDYSKMISVKVDRKTFIQVPVGADVEAVKNNYLKRLKNSKTEATHYKVLKKV